MATSTESIQKISDIIFEAISQDAEKINENVIAVPKKTLEARIHQQNPNIDQNPFEQDIARILYSLGLTLLKVKTQVYPGSNNCYPESSILDNRYTHSVKVAQTAERMAKYLGLNSDLANAIGLGHDIGHLAGGHPAEYEMASLMNKYEMKFSHDSQALRVLTLIEKINNKYRGLNLTYGTLLHFIVQYYIGLYKSDTHYTQRFTIFIEEYPKYSSFESQLLDLVDKFVYIAGDLGNALQLGVVTLEQLQNFPCFDSGLYEKVIDNYGDSTNIISDGSYAVKKTVYNYFLGAIYENCQKTIQEYIKQFPNHILLSKNREIDFNQKVRAEFQDLKDKMYNNVYFVKPEQFDKCAKRMINMLFYWMINHPIDKANLNYLKIPNFDDNDPTHIADIIWSFGEDRLGQIFTL